MERDYEKRVFNGFIYFRNILVNADEVLTITAEDKTDDIIILFKNGTTKEIKYSSSQACQEDFCTAHDTIVKPAYKIY